MWKLCFYMRYLPVSRRPVCRENVVSDGCDSCVDSIATSSWPGNQELLTLHPSQKKIVFTEKKTFKRSWTSTSVPKPRNCKPHAAAERQPLMVASDIPTAMPNSRALPTLELGVFSKKEWLSQSARWNVVILQESSWESKGTPPPNANPPPRKIRPC